MSRSEVGPEQKEKRSEKKKTSEMGIAQPPAKFPARLLKAHARRAGGSHNGDARKGRCYISRLLAPACPPTCALFRNVQYKPVGGKGNVGIHPFAFFSRTPMLQTATIYCSGVVAQQLRDSPPPPSRQPRACSLLRPTTTYQVRCS